MTTFLEHLTNTLEHQTILDLANYGADGGYSGLTYTADLVLLYDEYEEEIWAAANDDAADLGHYNTVEFINTFNVWKNWEVHEDQFKTGLVWYMAEREARRYADACANDEVA